MNTKKIKTAIIVMLVLANIFFIYNLYMLKENTSRIPRQMIEDAVTVLRKNGLNISKEAIPDIKPQNYIYEGVYSPEVFEEIAKSLSESEISNTFHRPGGVTYNAGEYKFDFEEFSDGFGDSSDYFTISITNISEVSSHDLSDQSGGDIYEDYEDLATKIENLILSGLKDHKKSDISRAENVIINFLKKYQPGAVDFETVGFQKNEESEYIVIKQKLDGLAFNSHVVFAEISGKKVRSFRGKWYFGEFAEGLYMPLLDSVNILFKCLEKDGNAIQDGEEVKIIELYYSILWHEKNKFYLIPSWRLSFDSGKVLSYNTLTGDRLTNN